MKLRREIKLFWLVAIVATCAALLLSSAMPATICAWGTYKLAVVSAPAQGGSFTYDPALCAAGTYANGTLVTLTAIPSAGYRFEKWFGDIDTNAADNTTVRIMMDAEHSITADFVGTSTTPTPEENVSLQIKCTVNSLGILQNNVSSSSLADTITVNISKGTELLGTGGKPLTQISVTSTTPPAAPPEGYHLLKSFNFAPDNAQFDPGITVTVSFDASTVADGKTVVLASYNATKSEWEIIKGKDNGNGTATFTIKHFSAYSLMYNTAEKASANVVLWVIIGIAIISLIALLAVRFIPRKAKRPDDFMPLS